MVSTSVLVFCGLLSAVSVDPTWSASGPVIQQCPTHGEIAPCVCTVKKNGGLDILCEFTDLQHISKTMAVLKGKPSLVIFYLKLRHNNLPKLQGFVFLGMDIRHLTIHNSTLAVVEESSLSSIGERQVNNDFSNAGYLLKTTFSFGGEGGIAGQSMVGLRGYCYPTGELGKNSFQNT